VKHISIIAALFLPACSLVNPSTAETLDRLNPLEVDPSDMAVQVVWPKNSAYGLGNSSLSLSAMRKSGESVQDTFELAQVGDVWRIAQGDYARYRALRDRVGAWKAEDPDGTQGSISVAAKPCLTGAPAEKPGRLSISIQVQDSGPFLPLVKDLPVQRLVDELGTEDIGPC
jgi:hypothetical protein